jgi:thioredoxin-like negative regulator of GroEL
LAYGCPPIDLVEVPRLKLAFNARTDHNGELRLYSVDHVDLFITNESNAFTAKLLAGIPHSLLLSNVRGEMQVLVPVIPPKRPRIAMEPFSTFIVLDRTKIPLAERFFLYPVHVSLSFLLTKGLNSAVYLMLLRFLHRDYSEVFRLADSIATDTKFNQEGQDIFAGFKNCNDDWHPDSHSCRLKISLVTIDSGTESPWDLTIECAKHTVKLGAVSSSCRLAPQEELQLLESENVVTSSSSPKYNPEKHSEYSMALCFNRQQLLRGVLKREPVDSIDVSCRIPPRAMSSNWPYYQDNTVFGENYSQMTEILSAEEGEHAWAVEVKGQGGDETDAPPGGWLVIACFHTLWSAGSLKCMPAVTELVPMYQDMVNFLSVRADCQGMVSISRKFEVKTFPTFFIFRGGQLLERIEGHERVVEKLVRLLSVHLKPSDKMAHSKHNHRIKTEQALLLGLEPPTEEVEERGQLDWCWDTDNCGGAMRVESDGMQAIIGDEDADDDRATWEYSYNNRNGWVKMPKDINKKLETKYKVGEMYSNCYYDNKFEIYVSNIEISSWQVTGWYGTEMSSYRTIYVRRTGDRLSVPGEEPYLTKEQKEKDKRSAEWREKLAAIRLKMKREKVGKDIEGMRGTIGMLPNTGTHIWTLRMNHEPPRFGTCHGIGICSDACESFGPASTPLLGGDGDSGASLALYANGELLHNGRLLHKFVGTRNLPVVEDATKASPGANESAGVAEQKSDDVVEPECSEEAVTDFTTIVVGTAIEGNYRGNGRWFKGKVTEIKEEEGGIKSYLITYEDGETEKNVPADFVRVFGAAAYEALQAGGAAHKIKTTCRVSGNYRGMGKWYDGTCLKKNADKTFDIEYDDGEIEIGVTADRIKYVGKRKKNKKAKDENTVPLENRAPLFGRKSLIRVELNSEEHGGSLEFFVDGVKLEGFPLHNVYKLLGGNEAFPCVCMCPFDLIDEATRAKQAEEAKAKAEAEAEAAAEKLREEEEGDEEDYNSEEEEAEGENEAGTTEDAPADGEKPKEGFVEDEFPSITLMPHDEPKKEGAAADAQGAVSPVAENKYDSKYTDSKNVVVSADGTFVEAAAKLEPAESKTAEGEAAPESLPTDEIAAAAATAEATAVASGENAGGEAESKSEPSAVTPPSDGTDKVVEVPIEKVRWMYETEGGWILYTPAASRELEEALRDGKSEYTITIGNSNHKCNLDTKRQYRSDSDNEARMRRHVMGDGLQGQWEILTMKYEKPSSFLSGASIIKILEKIWDSKESMSGKEAGFGFLFLYALLSGDMRCRIIGGTEGSRGSYGGYGPQPYNSGGSYSYGGKTVSTGSNDSHRFALLVTQLYSDKHTKSLPASIINVLGRNRQVSLRMPKFKDTRKATQTPFYNGWIDENEPRSPLADLMGKVVPMMTVMKRKGTFHFPPPPPHAELPAPPTSTKVKLFDCQAPNVDWDRPELSDFGCENRVLSSVEPTVVGQLATMIHYRLGEDELKPSPPVAVEDTAHFDKVIKDAGDKIVVVDFFATWCGPCQSLAPVFRLLAMQTPIAVFLKVDVDVCDELAARFKIESMPHTLFMRGGSQPSNVHTAINGGGPEYVQHFFQVIASMATEAEADVLKRFHSNTPGSNVKSIIQNMASDDSDVRILAKEPLKDCFDFVSFLSRGELALPQVNDHLAFDVSNHDSAKTAPAASVLARFRDDVKAFADSANNTQMPKMVKLTDLDITQFFECDPTAEETLKGALTGCKMLMKKLQQLRDADIKMLQDLIPLLEKCANWIEPNESDSDVAKVAKTKFMLSRIAGQNSFVWVEFLFGALLSTKGDEDLLKLNPYLSASTLKSILSLVTLSMLRANRLGHTNRCIGTVIALEALLSKTLKVPREDRAKQGPTLTPKLIQMGEALSKDLSMRRHYMKEIASQSGLVSTNKFEFDPRYLVFEFVWNIQLRQKQVEIVNDFRECLANNRSKVKQMIMGAGTVTSYRTRIFASLIL